MSLDREWEKYSGGPSLSTHNRMHVTIRHRGDIYLNKFAWNVLGKPKAVALYYNRERDEIAIEPADPRRPENFPVRERLAGYRIVAGNFCQHFRIRRDYAQTERFVNPDIDEQGILHLDLRNTVTIEQRRKGIAKEGPK
jgi:hypothetical protein